MDGRAGSLPFQPTTHRAAFELAHGTLTRRRSAALSGVETKGRRTDSSEGTFRWSRIRVRERVAGPRDKPATSHDSARAPLSSIAAPNKALTAFSATSDTRTGTNCARSGGRQSSRHDAATGRGRCRNSSLGRAHGIYLAPGTACSGEDHNLSVRPCRDVMLAWLGLRRAGALERWPRPASGVRGCASFHQHRLIIETLDVR
jgi:hypothetical protein